MAKLIVQLPNLLTLVRIVLVAPIIWSLWSADYRLAFLMFVIAGVSDLLDGYLARRFGWQSDLGATLDPLADKLLVVALAALLTVQGHLPLWLALIIVVRDLVIMSGAALYRFRFGALEVAPTCVSKCNTAAQIVVMGMLLLALCAYDPLSGLLWRLLDPAGFLVLGLLGVYSGIDYVVTWGLRAFRQRRSVA